MLCLRPDTPGGVFILLRDIKSAKHPVIDASDGGHVGIPMFPQITVMGMVHSRTLNPFFQPSGIAKLNMVVTKGTGQPE